MAQASSDLHSSKTAYQKDVDCDNECEKGALKKRDRSKFDKVTKKLKRARVKSSSNKLLPSGIMFDLKSGFVEENSDIPEPLIFLDMEYRIRLFDKLNN